MKVRYNGPSESFEYDGQIVGKGGIFTMTKKDWESDRLLPLRRRRHSFSNVDGMKADDQAAAVAHAETVVIPASANPQPVVNEPTPILTEAAPVPADQPEGDKKG